MRKLRKIVMSVGLFLLIVVGSFLMYSFIENKSVRKLLEDKEYVKKTFKGRARHKEDISIFVDFGLSSAYPRFFVYDNRKDTLLSYSKCAHGCGGGSKSDHPVFSNVPGSMCSSLGAYRLRKIDKLNVAPIPCIRIEGLVKTNSNAASRGIVIHEAPFFGDPISIGIPIPVTGYISQGCFSISSETFAVLCNLMRQHKSIYLYAEYKPKNVP